MNLKPIFIPGLAAFAVLFLFQWWFHGTYLADDYAATSNLWRSEEAVKELFEYCIGTKLVLGFIFAYIFAHGYKGGCKKEGLRFGVVLGLLLGVSAYASYVWLPVGHELALKWLAGGVVQGILVGIALGLTYKGGLCGACPTTAKKAATTTTAAAAPATKTATKTAAKPKKAAAKKKTAAKKKAGRPKKKK